MADCVNLKIPAIKKAYDELTKVFNSENIAYALLAKNNGYNLDMTPEGNTSELFNDLLENSNREQALKDKALIYTSAFLSKNNWIEKKEQYYEGNIRTEPNTIFVFGSNPEGRHGAGSAKVAREQFGAIYGQGEGLQGNAYALPTKDLRVKENRGFKSISPKQITENIKRLYEVATQNPDKQFKVAYRNTNNASLNGYTGLEMIDMFNNAGIIPTNIIFSKEWINTNKLNIRNNKKEEPSILDIQIFKKDFTKKVKGFQGYKGGFENIGKGTPQGDGKDKAMRKVANGFIGETLDYTKPSSTMTSANEINDKVNKQLGALKEQDIRLGQLNEETTSDNYKESVPLSGSVLLESSANNKIMLARNGSLKNRSLSSVTKNEILKQYNKGSEFVVGDMPGVDSQFIDYLQEIGASFTVYHTGNSPRIQVKQKPESSYIGSKAAKYLTRLNKSNIKKILQEDLILPGNKKLKNATDIANKLGESYELFKQNGLFLHEGDVNIIRRNADFLENLLDENNLVQRINDKSPYSHNVIGANKFNGKYWLKVQDSQFDKEYPFLTHEKRKENIIKRNLERIQQVNDYFKRITGREAITVKQSGKGYILEFNKYVIEDYNQEAYKNYLNSMNKYLTSKNEDISDFITSPLAARLDAEKSDKKNKKRILEQTGGKKSLVNALDNQIKELTEKIDKLDGDAVIKDIWDVAYDQLAKIDELLKQESVSTDEWANAQRQLDMWIASGDFTQEEHLFLDEEERQSDHYIDEFLKIRAEAEKRQLKLSRLGEKLLAKNINEEFGTELSMNQILSISHKLGLGTKVLSLNRVGQALAQYIKKIVDKANLKAGIESKIRSRELADIYKQLKDSGFDLNKYYQKDSNGIRTGRLIHKFSNKFFQQVRRIKSKVSDYKRDMLILNPYLLFEVSEENRQNSINNIKQHLGEKETQKYIEKARQKWEDYKEIREEFIKEEFGEGELSEEQQQTLKEWERNNSPVEFALQLTRSKKTNVEDLRGKDTFLVTVPRRFYKDGSETGFYDQNFDDIENNDIAYEFYQMAEEITNNTQAAYGHYNFSSTSLAFLEKSLLEKYNELGIGNFLSKELYDSLIRDLTTSGKVSDSIDPITGKFRKSVKGNLTALDKQITARYKELKNNREKEEARVLTEAEEVQLMSQASDEIFTGAKDNLFMALNIMNLSSLSLQHKHNIENAVNLAASYVPRSTFETGNEVVDSKGNPVQEVYIQKLQEQVDHFLDMSYYKLGKKDTSSTIMTLRTTEEKQQAKEINEKLKDPKLTEEEKNALKAQLSTIGNKVTTDKLFKGLLNFIRLKGLGWNIPAAITNIVYGKISNFIKAADGRLFNMKELGQAEVLLIKEGKKFNHVVENYSILGDILFEFKEGNKFEEKKNWINKTVKAVKPYALQTGTEKHNQGAVMIAMMLHNKVTNKETGEEKSMWEAIGDEGRLSDKWSWGNKTGENAITEIVTMIKSQVEEIHGDYSNPVLIKSTVGGQALGMFKMWFFEAVHNRFGKEKVDYIRGISTKGRYITAFQLFKQFKFKLRKAYIAYKNNELSEVDAANMRVNLIELATIMVSLVSGYLLKAAICRESKTCKDANATSMFLLNMQRRVNNEISFYLSPSQWKEFIQNPTAAANILGDISSLFDVTATLLDDDKENDTYTKGFYKDRNKLAVWLEKQIPAISQAKRLEKYGSEYLNLQ